LSDIRGLCFTDKNNLIFCTIFPWRAPAILCIIPMYVLCFESLTIFVLRHSLGNILYKLLQSIYKYFILKQKGFKYLHISEINYEWNYTFIMDIILIWNTFFYIGWLQSPYVVQWCWSHSSKIHKSKYAIAPKISLFKYWWFF